ncbi:MAG: polyprenol monophosphomannose synthase [Spirochaetaceae bacterium]
MSKNLIIIPTYNEIENISHIITKVFSNCPHVDILVVDGNSNDGTNLCVKDLMIRTKNLYLVESKIKEGLAYAYIQGFKWALNSNYDYICQFDADFSHQPKYLKSMMSKFDEKCDFVIGSRYINGGGIEGWSRFRSIISSYGSLYSRIILQSGIKDMTGGFNFWKKEVLESINFDSIISKGYMFQIELKTRAIKNGFSFLEFPIVFIERSAGKSKMSLKIYFEALFKVWLLRFIK